MVFATGMFDNVAPLPIETVLKLSAYHFHDAPLPNPPPLTLNVVKALFTHTIGVGLIIDEGATDKPFTVMV